MALVRETGSEIVAQFTVPLRGTWKAVAAHTVPLDALYDSMNVFVREGKLRSRPGLVKQSDTTFTEPIIGGVMLVAPQEKIVLAITRNRVYSLSGVSGVWSVLTPSGVSSIMANSDTGVADVALLETTGSNTAIIAVEGLPLKQWVYAPRSLSAITGTNIPLAKSVCISASRVVALISPHTVVWSAVQDPTSFDATAYAKRAQTGDVGICVRSLSSLAFVLYKERSIHPARAQAGLDDSTAFAFLEPIYVEGPAGIYAVVNVGGTHIYMTRNGRIGMFNGSSYPTWLADGLWLYLQDDINQSFAHLIRGVYDYRLHTVTFFYPKIGQPGVLRGMVTLNLPFQGQDLAETPIPRAFLGLCMRSITHGCEVRFDTAIDRSLLFSSPLSTDDRVYAYLYDDLATTDDTTPFTSSFQTGLTPMPDARHTTVIVESFVERGQGYGAAFIEPVISDALENLSGTIPDMSGQYIDLETNPVREYKGFGRQVRFFGLRYTWQSDNRFRYAGAVVYGSSLQKYRK